MRKQIEERIEILATEEAKLVVQMQQTSQLVARQNTALVTIRGGIGELKKLLEEDKADKEEVKPDG